MLNVSKSELSCVKQAVFFKNKVYIEVGKEDVGRKLSELIKQYPYKVTCTISWRGREKLPENAFILYSRYESKQGERKLLISWEKIKPNSKRVYFNKHLFGYTHTGKFYPGLLQKYAGERLGKNCISVPASTSKFFLRFFNELKIQIKSSNKPKEVFEYSTI